MTATDRGAGFKRGLESQGTLTKENPLGKPTSPVEKNG